jgi:predicted AAA+ superfamily ATPase
MLSWYVDIGILRPPIALPRPPKRTEVRRDRSISRNRGIGDVQVRHNTSKSPRCIVIAGPNGAGKTTFAREYLPREGGVIHFVNADLIASGLSPLRPEMAARQAGRLVLAELARLSKGTKAFCV